MVHVYNTAMISMRACLDRRKSALLSGHAARAGALAREGQWDCETREAGRRRSNRSVKVVLKQATVEVFLIPVHIFLIPNSKRNSEFNDTLLYTISKRNSSDCDP
jgi:hypothetical protein